MNRILIASLAILFVMVGCEALKHQAIDANSPLNKGVAAAGKVGTDAQSLGQAGQSAGIPFTWILTEGGTLLVALTGIYKAWRKKVLLDENISKYSDLEDTTRSIVNAIEVVGQGTVGTVIKEKIKANLSDKDFYQAGRAIISGLKG